MTGMFAVPSKLLFVVFKILFLIHSTGFQGYLTWGRYVCCRRFWSLQGIFMNREISIMSFQAWLHLPWLQDFLALHSTMDDGCCISKPSKELLHVSNVGADKDFFNLTTLGVPWIEYKASVRLQDADLVKRLVCFPSLCSSEGLIESFRRISWGALTSICIASPFFIPKSSRIAFLKRCSL